MLINYEKVKDVFEQFIESYNTDNGQISLKLIHTYGVVESCDFITKDLNLNEEDVELAKLIALLHDIGRFDQAVKYSSFVDYQTIDHADYGVNVLFDNGMIRKFIETDIYDEIIKKAIRNHNKYQIEDGLSEKELLHAKIIRDADKTDNFRVKATETLVNIDIHLNEENLQYDYISDKVYNEFMKAKTIISKERTTAMDMWVSYIAFIFDYNFSSGLKYIKEKNYIDILIDRIDYKNEDTKSKMEKIREFAKNYIDDRIERNNI